MCLVQVKIADFGLAKDISAVDAQTSMSVQCAAFRLCSAMPSACVPLSLPFAATPRCWCLSAGRSLTHRAAPVIGTAKYVAPEMLQGQVYDG